MALVGIAAYAAPATVHRVAAPQGLHPLAMQTGGRVEITAAPTATEFGGKNYTYQWPGSYFRAAFRGDRVFFRVGDGQQILHVMVDGHPNAILVKPTPGVYEVQGLSKGKHRIGVFVATESQAGPDAFGGFALPAGETARKLPRRKRQIEFIGDSYTVGFGNLSSTRTCSNNKIWRDTDDILAFGPRTARHYGADYQVNAISGRGVVRNYNGFKAATVPQAYPYVLFNKRQTYEDPSWRPQVIVIGLGTNDYSTRLHAGETWKTRAQLHADYQRTYAKFLRELRTRNPHAYMIVWAPDDSAHAEVETQAQKVVRKLQGNGFRNLTFLPIHGVQFTACDAHPSLTGDQTISNQLVQRIDAHKAVWRH